MALDFLLTLGFSFKVEKRFGERYYVQASFLLSFNSSCPLKTIVWVGCGVIKFATFYYSFFDDDVKFIKLKFYKTFIKFIEFAVFGNLRLINIL